MRVNQSKAISSFTRLRFYVGIINDRPAYSAHSRESITCELFFDYKSARRKYHEVCRVEVEPCTKVIGGAEELLPKPWYSKAEPLEAEYRKRWLQEWWYRRKLAINLRWRKLKTLFEIK